MAAAGLISMPDPWQKYKICKISSVNTNSDFHHFCESVLLQADFQH
jgi:hypothetical protein